MSTGVSPQNIIPVQFPTVKPKLRKTKANAGSPINYVRENQKEAKAHPDAYLIAACVDYCVAAAGGRAAYDPDPTDSHFAGVVDTRLLRRCDRLASSAMKIGPTTLDGLHAMAHVALLMTDSEKDPGHITILNQDFLNIFARNVLRHCRQARDEAAKARAERAGK